MVGKRQLHTVIDLKPMQPHLLLGVTQYINNVCDAEFINVKLQADGSLKITKTVEANQPLQWYYGHSFFGNIGRVCYCPAHTKIRLNCHLKQLQRIHVTRQRRLKKRQDNAARNLNHR
jgi:hypothetical protein